MGQHSAAAASIRRVLLPGIQQAMARVKKSQLWSGPPYAAGPATTMCRSMEYLHFYGSYGVRGAFSSMHAHILVMVVDGDRVVIMRSGNAAAGMPMPGLP